MREVSWAEVDDARFYRIWRMFLIALCSLILCSCRGPETVVYDTASYDTASYDIGATESTTLPESAFTGVPAAYSEYAVSGEAAAGVPGSPAGPWAPPGFSQPWPKDEYLRDGGDRGLPAEVREDWEVLGLELEDTVAHYDTVDGRTEVEPSNRIHIYSPRFGAVRQVSGLVSNKLAARAAGMHLPERLSDPTTVQVVTASQQHFQPGDQVGVKPPVAFESRQGDGVVSTTNKAKAFQQDPFMPYENLQAIRYGIFESAEMAWLSRSADAAVAWTTNQAVQVILDEQTAAAAVSDQLPAAVFTIEESAGKSKLRIVKVASTDFAEPGDEVAFTIRFDNVGSQVIGNVTIIDNLTTRLQYVADSAECSLAAQFFTQPNEGDSLAIRCEVTDPLEPGQGGILRFRCRVR